MSTIAASRGYLFSVVQPDPDQQAPRQAVRYACPKNHEFEVPFSADAEVPPTWECSRHGTDSKAIAVGEVEKKVKAPRTHWDMLRERRTIPELEAVLAERLALLRERRGRCEEAGIATG